LGEEVHRRSAARKVKMGLDLSAAEYLKMLNEEYAEYKKEPISIRRAINCCGFANALAEIIFVQYGKSEPAKVHNATDLSSYRAYLRKIGRAHHTVRDLCDLTKRSVVRRESVEVRIAAKTKRWVGLWQSLLAFTTAKEVERLVVTFENGRTQVMDEILREVVDSWNRVFRKEGL
jgi:hypothetical protein